MAESKRKVTVIVGQRPHGSVFAGGRQYQVGETPEELTEEELLAVVRSPHVMVYENGKRLRVVGASASRNEVLSPDEVKVIEEYRRAKINDPSIVEKAGVETGPRVVVDDDAESYDSAVATTKRRGPPSPLEPRQSADVPVDNADILKGGEAPGAGGAQGEEGRRKRLASGRWAASREEVGEPETRCRRPATPSRLI